MIAETVIRRVRCRALRPVKQAEALSAELRLRTLLGGASFRARALPPQAILCVRRLRDPKPGALRLHQPVAPSEWEAAVGESLDQMARRAVRIAFQVASDDAPAIWFADSAEMLAAMAKAALDHSLCRDWWWRALLGAGDLLPAVKQRWRESGPQIPAAIELLHAAGKSTPFLSLLGEAESRVLVAAMFKAYGIAEPRLTAVSPEHASSRPAPHEPSITARTLHAAGPSIEIANLADHPVARYLLATALFLRRDPAGACRLSPQTESPIVHSEPCPTPQPAALCTTPAETGAPLQSSRPSLDAPALQAPTVQAPPDGHLTRRALIQSPQHRDSPAEVAGESPPHAAADHQPTFAQSAQHEAMSQVSPFEISPDAPQPRAILYQPAPGVASAEPAHPASDLFLCSEPTRDPLEGIATGLGGIFFLLNVGLYLELYGDFTVPLAPGISLNIWDFIELAGRALDPLPPESPFNGDPIWPLLVELAGRPANTPAGAGFEPPRNWTIPTDWLRAVDLPLVDAPGEADLFAWLRWLMPYVRARLTSALRIDDPSRLGQHLLRHRARIFISPMHVDVVYSLQTHPVEIRCAGLDRDPGWIPAAGRWVTFHFE